MTRGRCDCGATTRYVERPNGFYVYTKNRGPAASIVLDITRRETEKESRRSHGAVCGLACCTRVTLTFTPPPVIHLTRGAPSWRSAVVSTADDMINLFPAVGMHVPPRAHLQKSPAISFAHPRVFRASLSPAGAATVPPGYAVSFSVARFSRLASVISAEDRREIAVVGGLLSA